MAGTKNIFCFIIGLMLILLVDIKVSAQVLGLELLNGKEELEIDFDYSNGFIIIKVRLNNLLPLNFIFDTGAEHVILFKKEISDVLGLQYEKRINLMGSDLEKEVFAFITRNVLISIPGTNSVNRDLIVLEDDFINLDSRIGETIDGILGSRFFRGLILEFDYAKKKLVLYDQKKFKPPTKNKNYSQIEIKVENFKPYITSNIITVQGDTIQLKLLIDTGSALPFLLFLNTHSSLILPDNFIRGNLGTGLGGDLEGYLSLVKEFKLTDQYVFNNLITSFQYVDPNLNPEYYRNRNGLIGNPILSRFHVYLDLLSQQIYIKPRKNYNKKFKHDKSGMLIYAFGHHLNQYYVKDVIENSPAAEVGIKKGDLIMKVGLFPANFYDLNLITKKLQKKTGKKVRFTLIRNGEKLKKTIVLRDLVTEKRIN